MLNIKLAAVTLSGVLALGGYGLAASETQAAAIEDVPRTVLTRLRGTRGPLIPLVNPGERDGAIAAALGITVGELEEAREAGIHLPALAADLDVDMADVVDTLQVLLIDEVEEAVAEGDMTQERADHILERLEVANVMRDYFGLEARLEVLADALDMNVDELLAAREDGLGLRALIAEQEVDPADIREAMSAARERAINAALEDNVLTEEQAERLLEAPGYFLPRGLRGRFLRFGPQSPAEGAVPSPSPLLNG